MYTFVCGKLIFQNGNVKEIRHDIIPRQMIAVFGEQPYCMLDVVLYTAVNIIRLPHLVVELMTDTRLAEGYVSA